MLSCVAAYSGGAYDCSRIEVGIDSPKNITEGFIYAVFIITL